MERGALTASALDAALKAPAVDATAANRRGNKPVNSPT
jgi:hypothetical protein